MLSNPSLTRVDSVLDTKASDLLPKITLSDLCEDVLLIICSHLESTRDPLETPLKNLSLVNQRLSQVLLPHLLKSLHINAPLKLLRRSQGPLAHYHAHSLKIDMFGSLWWWCSGLYVDSSDAIDLFEFIQSLQHLKTLEVSMLGRSLDLFEAAFATTTTTPSPSPPHLFLLPQITHLVLTPSASFLARHCPQLRSLVIRDNGACTVESYTDLETRLAPARPAFAAGSLPASSLTHLDTTAVWSTPELAFLVFNFPKLTHLTMASESYTYRAPVSSIFVALGRLRLLRVLRLNRVHKLDVGYRSVWKRRVQECKTREQRMRLWNEDERARVRAENDVVRSAFRCCGGLGEVWLGGERVARRVGGVDREQQAGLRWVWEKWREDVEMEGVSILWARYRVEKEGVVVRWELGI